jgi:26S proteasome non-ATPase regulatory subunit 10
MVSLLLENRSPLNATDASGYTALHHGKIFSCRSKPSNSLHTAISEGHGDTAMVLIKAGAEVDKKDVDGHLAIELAPDSKVWLSDKRLQLVC